MVFRDCVRKIYNVVDDDFSFCVKVMVYVWGFFLGISVEYDMEFLEEFVGFVLSGYVFEKWVFN